MKGTFESTDDIITILILFLVLFFIKGILSILGFFNLDTYLKKSPKYSTVKETVDTILDTMLLLFGLYVLFLRTKPNSMLVIILAILFLLKGFFQYFLDLKFYKYTNLDIRTVDKLKQIKVINSMITDGVIFFSSFYMVKYIFGQ